MEINLYDLMCDIDTTVSNENSDKEAQHRSLEDSNRLSHSGNSSAPKKIAFSKLVSFFSSRVRVNKSVVVNSDDSENFSNSIQDELVDVKDYANESTEVKTEVNSEDDLEGIENPSSIFASSFSELNVKNEDEKLCEVNIKKFKVSRRFFALKITN